MIKKYGIILSVFFASLMAGCSHSPSVRPVLSGDNLLLKDICDRYGVYWEWDSVSQVVTLQKDEHTAKAMVGSEIVLVSDEKIYLTSAVKTVGGAIVVPPDFRRKIINKFGASEETTGINHKVYRVRHIVIDAGHGGKDSGALGKMGTQEKDIVLDIAKRLEKIIENQGFKVTMTRTRDEFISLQKRTEIASSVGADLFVSIHANASTQRSAHGLEVYALRDLGVLEKRENQRVDNHKRFYKSLRMKQGDASLESILEDMLYDHKQEDSKNLALSAADNMAKEVKARNRGQKHARFYVLRNTVVPAILVETGFLSNAKEERLLNNSLYRQRLARSLAKTILAYAEN